MNFVVFVLVIISSFLTILTNGQLGGPSLADIWQIGLAESSFLYEEGSFSIFFEVSNFIQVLNLRMTMWSYDEVTGQGCQEGGFQLVPNATSGIPSISYSLSETGQAIATMDMDMDILSNNPELFKDFGNMTGSMNLCARFMLYTLDGLWEVNYLEVLIMYGYKMEGGITLDWVNLNPIIVEEVEGEKDYGVVAFLCNLNGDPLNTTQFFPGAPVTVCVAPNQKAIDDGLLLESIDSFTWVRDFIEQPAIMAGEGAWNQLTAVTCTPGSVFCQFTSVLYSDFFQAELGTASPTPMPVEIDSTEGVYSTYLWAWVSGTQVRFDYNLNTECGTVCAHFGEGWCEVQLPPLPYRHFVYGLCAEWEDVTMVSDFADDDIEAHLAFDGRKAFSWTNSNTGYLRPHISNDGVDWQSIPTYAGTDLDFVCAGSRYFRIGRPVSDHVIDRLRLH